ncbi:OmpA family protein [Rheinheimera sp.]|uniref:MotY family protein n=1 Tax=Rheinheimera sp. TaxID=1869214 RepID=UPI00307FB6DB
MNSTLVSLAFSAIMGSTAATVVVPAMDQSEWRVSGNQFQCRMQQQLGSMATLSFRQEPAKALELWLDMNSTHLQLQDVRGRLVPADWQPGQYAPALQLAATEITQAHARFVEQVPVVLQQLQQGYWLELWLDLPGQELSLKVPNLKSAAALTEFQRCTTSLLPLSWEQARDYQLHYLAGERQPTAAGLAHLQLLARYIKEDKAVRKVLIDGHSDDAGSSLANRLASEERADEVAARFIEWGVPKKQLEIRAHGNRYPLARNQSNNRVVLRLIRSAG